MAQGAQGQEVLHAVSHRQTCGNCGTTHRYRQCPAYLDVCSACGAKGHWSQCCRKTRGGKVQGKARSDVQGRDRDTKTSFSPGRKKKHRDSRKSSKFKNVHCLESDYSTDGEAYQKDFFSITISNKCLHEIAEARVIRSDEAYTCLDVQPPGLKRDDYTLKLKIDTGASGNTLPLRTFHQMYGTNQKQLPFLQPAHNVKLTVYNGQEITCVGKLDMPCQFRSSGWKVATFYVVDVPGPAVVGLPTSRELNLVTINTDAIGITKGMPAKSILKPKTTLKGKLHSIDDLRREYPNQFDQIGNFPGEAKLLLKDDAEPFIDAPRKCSIHLKDKLRAELQSLVEQGVIRKVEEHTDWCSSLAFSTKKDGSLRICLDPQRLNKSLRRCPHRIPTVEELNPAFAKAKVFSKLDAKAGYWSVHLDDESQLLTTFRTPFGRFCWKRLPFGLSTSQDIFQARMDQILEGLDGVVGIADDVCVFGQNDDDHDDNLINLMNRAADKGLVFNSSKCAIKTDSISFFGNLYTADGIKPDPAKVQDIRNMPTPRNKEELESFLGMMNYLSQFIPHFALKTETLRGLVKAKSPWTWDETYQTCYDELKNAISDQSCVKYYDANTPTELQVDASQKGLGAALVQNHQPIVFASKALNECQSRYSNIEREMLAVVHGIQRFHTYLFGQQFTVITDHKPLVAICAKPLHAAPPRLQRMLLKIQGYNFTIQYRPGTEMVLADTLSRLPNPKEHKEIPLDVQVHTMDLEVEDPEGLTVALINFRKEKEDQLREETKKDPVLNSLAELIYVGWPNAMKELPTSLRPYWFFRDELVIEAGVILKGRQILIPKCMQHEILEKLHDGHQGVEKTRRLSRESVYWLNINKDIEALCKQCPACQENQDGNQKEPLIPHECPAKPWQHIASDLFEIKGQQYLLTVDRYTKYPLVEQMNFPVTSQRVADKIKSYCSLFGRPERLTTDNGPQYTGQEFKKSVETWGIDHHTTSPHYSRSNGFIERHVRHIKSVLKKTIQSGQDIQLALLNLRATPIDCKLPSPGELMFSRPLTTLPSCTAPDVESHRHHMYQQQMSMKNHHDRTSRQSELPSLHVGQPVRILNTVAKTWCPARYHREALH